MGKWRDNARQGRVKGEKSERDKRDAGEKEEGRDTNGNVKISG
mgnify:CR=1 FL=1